MLLIPVSFFRVLVMWEGISSMDSPAPSTKYAVWVQPTSNLVSSQPSMQHFMKFYGGIPQFTITMTIARQINPLVDPLLDMKQVMAMMVWLPSLA